MSDYPKMLYRECADGAHAFEDLDRNRRFETRVVEDEQGELEAGEEGWADCTATMKGLAKPAKADPFDHDGDGKPGGSKPKAKPAE